MFHGDTFFRHVLRDQVRVTLHGLAKTTAPWGADRHYAEAAAIPISMPSQIVFITRRSEDC